MTCLIDVHYIMNQSVENCTIEEVEMRLLFLSLPPPFPFLLKALKRKATHQGCLREGVCVVLE